MASDELVKDGLGHTEAAFMAIQRAHGRLKDLATLLASPALERPLIAAQMELVVATEQLQAAHGAFNEAMKPQPNRAQRRAGPRKASKTKSPPARRPAARGRSLTPVPAS